MAKKIVTILGITGKQVTLAPLFQIPYPLLSTISSYANTQEAAYSLTENRVPPLPMFSSEREAGTSAAWPVIQARRRAKFWLTRVSNSSKATWTMPPCWRRHLLDQTSSLASRTSGASRAIRKSRSVPRWLASPSMRSPTTSRSSKVVTLSTPRTQPSIPWTGSCYWLSRPRRSGARASTRITTTSTPSGLLLNMWRLPILSWLRRRRIYRWRSIWPTGRSSGPSRWASRSRWVQLLKNLPLARPQPLEIRAEAVDMTVATRWHLCAETSCKSRWPGCADRCAPWHWQVSRVDLKGSRQLTFHVSGEFVKALLKVPAGQNLLGVASTLSWNEYAALWGKVNGVTCRFERLDRKVLEDAIPGGIGEEMADMFEYISEFGYHGGDPTVVLPKDVSDSPIPRCGVHFLTWEIAWRGRPGVHGRRIHQGRRLDVVVVGSKPKAGDNACLAA